jgi:hypothetical protein
MKASGKTWYYNHEEMKKKEKMKWRLENAIKGPMNRNYEVQGETLKEITAKTRGTCWVETAKRLAKIIKYKKKWDNCWGGGKRQKKKWWTVVMTYKSGGGKSENSIVVNNVLFVEGS